MVSVSFRLCFVLSLIGMLYLGNVCTVLINWLLVRLVKGTLVFRIEDTDVVCNVVGVEWYIFETLCWFGIDWDEGSDVGG